MYEHLEALEAEEIRKPWELVGAYEFPADKRKKWVELGTFEIPDTLIPLPPLDEKNG